MNYGSSRAGRGRRGLILVLYALGPLVGPVVEGREGADWLLVDLHVEAEQEPCAPLHDPLHCLVCRALDARALIGHEAIHIDRWPGPPSRTPVAESRLPVSAPGHPHRLARAPPAPALVTIAG